MATITAKTYMIPPVVSIRTTCAGTHSTVGTPECIDIVAVKDAPRIALVSPFGLYDGNPIG